MAHVQLLRLQRHSAQRKPAREKKALQEPIDYITGEKLWEENKWPEFWSGLRFSYLTLRRRQRIESKKSILCELLRHYLWRLQVLEQYLWNLLFGLANRSSLLLRLVQQALIMPREVSEPAKCVSVEMPLCFPRRTLSVEQGTPIQRTFKDLNIH